MKNKNEVYVEVRTEKQANGLKKVLDMFGEEYSDLVENILLNKEEGTPLSRYKNATYMSYEQWSLLSSPDDDKTKVSITELRNILAQEHLKEGDVCVVSNESYKYIAKIESVDNHVIYPINSTKHVVLGETTVTGAKGTFQNFIRYATEEEKALLEPKKELEIGKWYKDPDYPKFLSIHTKDGNRYGFDIYGKWFEGVRELCYSSEYIEATPEEVEKSLIEEARKRGITTLPSSIITCDGHRVDGLVSIRNFHRLSIGDNYTVLTLDGAIIFLNGKWAEIIKPFESKKVKVIIGGSGANGATGLIGYTVERSSVDFNNYSGKLSTEIAEVYIKILGGDYWGLCDGYSIKEIEEIEIGDWVSYKSGDIPKVTKVTETNLKHYSKADCERIKDKELINKLNNL